MKRAHCAAHVAETAQRLDKATAAYNSDATITFPEFRIAMINHVLAVEAAADVECFASAGLRLREEMKKRFAACKDSATSTPAPSEFGDFDRRTMEAQKARAVVVGRRVYKLEQNMLNSKDVDDLELHVDVYRRETDAERPRVAPVMALISYNESFPLP